MGLGAPKNRQKLSHDPNNTAWSRSTENFGHRILSSQGWKPGEYLGASNAAHADHYTAANASHVRVLLREDNLGIGAKVGGKGNAETFGLSTLSSIFGRLNGKSEVEVQTQQANIRNAELRTWQAQKYGFMNFVSGGLLVGDKMEEPVEAGRQAQGPSETVSSSSEDVKHNKKRKVEEATPDSAEEKPSKKKKRSSSKPRGEPSAEVIDGADQAQSVETGTNDLGRDAEKTESSEDPESKAARRARKAARKAIRAAKEAGKSVAKDEKARAKEEKRARKEERRRRKEEKRSAKAVVEEAGTVVDLPTPSSGVATPVSAALAFGGGRHAVRQRYIQQKRMATRSLDPQALKEILMIKAQA